MNDAAFKKPLFIFSLLLAAALACLSYSYFVEPFRLVVNAQTIKVKNWNPAFDGLRVVLVSDIHGGARGITGEKLRSIVETVNAQNADAVFLLGDYVSNDHDHSVLKMPMATVADNLSGIEAKFGVYAVTGNHDFLYDEAEVRRQLERVGIRVLVNEVSLIEKDGHKLRIFGLEDHLKIKNWDEFAAKLEKIIAPTDGQGDVLVLEHSPDVAPMIVGERLVSKDLRLFLAGHTHGGQINLPVLGAPIVPSNFGQRYAKGFVRDSEIDVFVTTGIGTSLLPFRFGVPPEIVVLEIKSE